MRQHFRRKCVFFGQSCFVDFPSTWVKSLMTKHIVVELHELCFEIFCLAWSMSTMMQHLVKSDLSPLHPPCIPIFQKTTCFWYNIVSVSLTIFDHIKFARAPFWNFRPLFVHIESFHPLLQTGFGVMDEKWTQNSPWACWLWVNHLYSQRRLDTMVSDDLIFHAVALQKRFC